MRRLVLFRPLKTKIGFAIPVVVFVIVLCVALITMVAMPLIGLDRAQAADPVQSADSFGSWQKEAGAGFEIGSGNFMAWPMVGYKGAVYVGVGNKKGSEVRAKNGSSWSVVSGSASGFGNPNNMAILCMKVYNNKLYAGTLNYNQGCEIWCYDGSSWTEVVGGSVYGPGFGYPSNMAAFCMEVHANKLYVGTLNLSVTAWPPSSQGAQIWTYDGATCQPAMSGGFGDTRNYAVTALKEYNGTLYAGTLCVAPTYNLDIWTMIADVTLNSQGCQLWSLGASTWNKVAVDGFGRMENAAVSSMEVYGNQLLIATASGTGTISVTVYPSVDLSGFSWKSAGLSVYSYAGGSLTAIQQGGLEDSNDFGILAMSVAPINGKDFLLAAVGKAVDDGTGKTTLGGYLAAYDGSKWFRASEDGFGNSNNELVTSLETLNGRIYAGTVNTTEGCEIWSVDPNTPTEPLVIFTFYFAEGYTGTGFQEYLSIGNPTAAQADATITYMFKEGGTQSQAISIPANSRATVDVNNAVGAGRDVSAKVESEQQIVVERPMYFNYQSKWTGGHDVVGATAPAYTWYFAEGYTGTGFDEWVCVLNPGSTAAALTLRFQTQEAGEKVIDKLSVPANSRQTFKANDLLGGKAYQTSLTLTSTQPVVAERPIYFDYTGTGNWHWNGGHCVMGTTNPASSYYFAEGTTRLGFEEWLTLQNPGLSDLTVNAVYQLGPGQGDPVTKSYPLPAASRQTVFVPKEVGTDKDVSVYLSCSSAFLAERPMYFNYGFGSLHATGGHCVIGAPEAGKDWFLAEGFTGSNFNEWLCLQNPGDTDATCEVTYYTQEAGALPVKQVTIPAKTRKTIMVNEDAGPNYQLSARVRVTSGPSIVVERPMYFIFRGWSGGHDVVGFL